MTKQEQFEQAHAEPIDQLVTALAVAQAKMPNATFNKVNPHFKSKYADLTAIREATLPILSENGLAIIQFTGVDESGNLLLHTRLAHKSGQYIESVYPLPVALDKPQAMGSAMTYAKRYSWAAMCGIASDEDDDANAAQGATANGTLKKPDGKVTQKQADELIALADEVGADKALFCGYLSKSLKTEINSIADIPASGYGQAKTALEKKREEADAA